MIPTTQRESDGLIYAARSDCGTVSYDHALSADGLLHDHGADRPMWRGMYPNADGHFGVPGKGEPVPAEIWDIACKLMRDVDAHNKRIADAAREAALESDLARTDVYLSEQTARRMYRDDAYDGDMF